MPTRLTMRKFNLQILLLLLPLSGFAAQGFVIKGKVTGIISGYVSVIAREATDKPMPEKVRIVNGEFTYAGTIDRPDLVILKISTRSVYILLENVNYEVHCAFDSLSTRNVKGSIMNDQYSDFLSSRKSPVDYFREHAGDEIAPWLAYYFLHTREDAEVADKLLTMAGKSSANGQLFLKRMEVFNRTSVGKMFPTELKMTDVNGQPFLMKEVAGKVVVLDFWASWCAPCIAFIPKLKEHYASFKDRNVVVVSVSVDENMDKWKRAMVEQSMDWTQVLAEGAFRKDEGIQKIFHITGIPYVIVVGKDGKIAATMNYEDKNNLAEVLEKIINQSDSVR